MKPLTIFLVVFFISLSTMDASANSYVYDETIACTVINENDRSTASQYDFFEIGKSFFVRSDFLRICGEVSLRHDLIFLGDLNSNKDENTLIENGEIKNVVAENCYNEKYYFHSEFNISKKGRYKINVIAKTGNDLRKIDEYFFQISEYKFFHPGIIFTEREAMPYTSLTPQIYFTNPEKIIANDTFGKMCGEVSISHEWTYPNGLTEPPFYSEILGTPECGYGEVSFVSELSGNFNEGKYTVKSFVKFSEGVSLSYTNSFWILEKGLYYNKTVFWNGLGDVVIPKILFKPSEEVFINTSFFQVCSDVNVKYVLHFPNGTEKEFILEVLEAEDCESARSAGTFFTDLFQLGMHTVEVQVYSIDEYVTLETIKFVIGGDLYPPLAPWK